ncbi:MAG TPA: hypothetical protein VJ276_07275 [Thermoanaerobaculia bacterium]|nr:hypothetical protein [Thermoanaerobaculia bacterium]
MNTSAETIDNFASDVRKIANSVAERLGLKIGCSVDDQGTFFLVNFAFKRPILMSGEWVMEHPMTANRWIDERIEAALQR